MTLFRPAFAVDPARATNPPRDTSPCPVPAGWRLRLADGVRVLDGGRLLVGGSPLRMLTLSDRGARLLAGWLAGQPAGEAQDERLLARRLLDAGLADPDPPPRHARPTPPPSPPHPHPLPSTDAEVTIVVPVYADPERLAACLAALAGGPPVIVVDDGSPDGDAIAVLARRFGVRYIRHPGNRGQAAARNTGWRAADTPLVAFLDADCVPPPGFPGPLVDHLADPAIGLVAPRIVSGARSASRIARYERVRSALDMGARPSMVRPYSPVWYVPSAAMVARRDALGHGFDERLSLGEDVDLVWRLHDAGWQIRYEPRITVAHDDRIQPMAWYRRRIAYNESVAPLLERHPERVPVLFLSPATALAWGAAMAGRSAPVLALTGLRAARLRRAVAGRFPGAGAWAARAALEMTLHEARDLGRALAGPWAPLALFAGRRRAATLIATMLALDWLTDRPALDPLSYAALRLADESTRGLGIWLGCIRARDFRGLLPRRPPPPSRRQAAVREASHEPRRERVGMSSTTQGGEEDTMADRDEERHAAKPTEQRGGSALGEGEAQRKGDWAAKAKDGVVPAELGGSDASADLLPADRELGSSVLGRPASSDEPATETGVDPRGGDRADATSDGGPEVPDGVEPDLKDIGSGPRRVDVDAARREGSGE